MKKTKLLCAIILAVVFILIPLPPAALYIRIQFDEIAGDKCTLYYATDTTGGFSEEQCILSKIDPDTNQVTFRLDSSLDGHLTDLRIDFPPAEDLVCIKTITASSAGIIQDEYNPCHFFANDNIASTHEADITLVHPTNRVYISTTENDPYIVLSSGLTAQLQDHYSHFGITRLFVCILVAIGYLFARKNPFSA